MEALVTAFVAAALAEWGDKSQLLVAALAAATTRKATLFAGFLVAALASSLAAAYAGLLVGSTVTLQASGLMVALALLFAAVAGLIRRATPSTGSGRTPLFLAAIILCLAAELGDRSQFLTFALAGRFGSAPLAAAGATAGMAAAALPALLLGPLLVRARFFHPARLAGAALFFLAGLFVLSSALRIA